MLNASGTRRAGRAGSRNPLQQAPRQPHRNAVRFPAVKRAECSPVKFVTQHLPQQSVAVRGQGGVGAQEDEHVVKAEAVRPVLVVTMPVTIVERHRI